MPYGKNAERILKRGSAALGALGIGAGLFEYYMKPDGFPKFTPPSGNPGMSGFNVSFCLANVHGEFTANGPAYCGPVSKSELLPPSPAMTYEHRGYYEIWQYFAMTWNNNPFNADGVWLESMITKIWEKYDWGWGGSGPVPGPDGLPKIEQGYKAAPMPTSFLTFPAEWPHWNPVSDWYQPSPRPIRNPVQRPDPWSPESPDVGPRPNANPNPVPVTPTTPVPEGLPEAVPEVAWQPVPVSPPHMELVPRGLPRTNTARHRDTKPPRGTKEKKARMNRTMGYLWNAVSNVTEAIDFANFMYECLPWKLKVSTYQAQGRQPNPAEKVAIIYKNINKLDVGCALTSYVKEKIEDRLYAIGSKQIAEASRNDNRPIGYEAGGSLTGGNMPFIQIL